MGVNMTKKKSKPIIPFFVHIPRSAGNYVKTMMRAYGIDTATSPHRAGHYIFGSRDTLFDKCPDWKEYKKRGPFFCVIRNPFDLLVSWFFHGENGFRDQAKDCNDVGEFIDKYIRKELDFKDFCENPFFQLFSDEGEFVPDKVLKQETVSVDIKKFLEEECSLKLLFDERVLPARDRSLRRAGMPYRVFYTDEQRKELEKRWKPILDKFGYSF